MSSVVFYRRTLAPPILRSILPSQCLRRSGSAIARPQAELEELVVSSAFRMPSPTVMSQCHIGLDLSA